MTSIRTMSAAATFVQPVFRTVGFPSGSAGTTAGLALAALLAGSCWPVLAQTPPTAGPALEEIVVTAQRVEQKLQNVPITVTAFSPTQIEDQHIDTIQDLGFLVPNFYAIEESGSGNAAVYTLRGITTPQFSFQLDSGIGVYLDGVYIGRDLGTQFESADIQRIEVLSGPQGTLFGRNTTGGLINYISRTPSGNWDAHQELTFGNFGRFRSLMSTISLMDM